jgi:ADP-heptose:LPS heptosyltransferase
VSGTAAASSSRVDARRGGAPRLKEPPRDRRPLLVAYRALGLGDLLTGVPALRALARAHPGHRRVLCAPAALAPVAALTGVIDAVAHTAPLAHPPADLRGTAVAVNLHGRGPESHRALQATRPDRLIAFRCPEAGHHAGPEWDEDEHERDRWCRLLADAGIPADPLDLELRPPDADPPAGAAGATVIHPGAASAARRWPAARWAEVATRQRDAGHAVLITGSGGEADLARTVAEGAGLPSSAVLAGHTDLARLAALIAVAGRVVCGDTGVAHLATALGTPSVVLFGPSSPAAWGPPADRSRHVVLWAGQRGDPHADRPDHGLLALDVEDVCAALARLPGRVDAAG